MIQISNVTQNLAYEQLENNTNVLTAQRWGNRQDLHTSLISETNFTAIEKNSASPLGVEEIQVPSCDPDEHDYHLYY